MSRTINPTDEQRREGDIVAMVRICKKLQEWQEWQV